MKRLVVYLIIALVASCIILLSYFSRLHEAETAQVSSSYPVSYANTPDPVASNITHPSIIPLAAPPPIKQHLSKTLMASRGVVLSQQDTSLEIRDDEWASPTERSIKDALVDIPYIDISTISVVCGSSLCKATGKSKSGISNSNNLLISDYIENERFFSNQASMNALPKRSVYNEEPGGGTFVVEFARVHK